MNARCIQPKGLWVLKGARVLQSDLTRKTGAPPAATRTVSFLSVIKTRRLYCR